MEQLTLLQNQFPVEEVKVDIMFKCKLCIYNIYIKHMHIAITQKIMKTLVTCFYEIFGNEQRLLLVNSVSAIQQSLPNILPDVDRKYEP